MPATNIWLGVSVEDLRRFLAGRGMRVPPALAPASDGGALKAAKPARRRALVIDDDETLLDVMKEILSASGWDVETARHGFLAGYLAGHHRPDVIVLDIMMPGLDGYEVLSLMRRRPEARAVPVIACTSLKGPETEERIRSAGFDAYRGDQVIQFFLQDRQIKQSSFRLERDAVGLPKAERLAVAFAWVQAKDASLSVGS